jgi:hypothetical protein
MNIYSLARPLLFQFDAESVHDFTLKSLKTAERLGGFKIVCISAYFSASHGDGDNIP